MASNEFLPVCISVSNFLPQMNGIDYCSESTRGHMASSSLAICGLARDCAATLPQNKALIEKLRTFFGSSMVVIVENDSSDQTRQQLDGWASECNDVFIMQGMPLQDEISTKKNRASVNPFYSLRRISKMASLRNQYINFLVNSGSLVDYLLVLDLDVSQIDLGGVMDSFEKREAWDVITAYGYSLSPFLKERYHDSFALVPLGEQSMVKTERSIKKLQGRFRLEKNSDKLVSVTAAFGGLSIYKTRGQKLPLYKAEPNADARVEATCEHIGFTASFVQSSGPVVKINPRMHLRYQTVIDALKRKIPLTLKKIG
jgi:hypothetical protein